jgi:hypothetical protein
MISGFQLVFAQSADPEPFIGDLIFKRLGLLLLENASLA